MAYARQFGQSQGASPWSAGVPPGVQQTPQQAQQMFSQPMGAFDLSGAWQSQQQQQQATQATPGHWAPPPIQAMQAPVQFVPNSAAFMQQPHPQVMMAPQHHQPQRYQQQQQQQNRSMHQRSLSAPRVGNVQNKRLNNNQNNSFGGGQWQQRQQPNNNGQQQQRTTRQQSRTGNQKVQFNNNNNNNSNNNNNNNHEGKNSTRQQQQQQQQQNAKGTAAKVGQAKVTKAVKKQALVKANKGVVANNSANNDKDATNDAASADQAAKPQSKTAERKQLKLQARKNAEALAQSKLPVVKSAKASGEKTDEPVIDQSQLKCVPAVFGFVCKACDVFLRDRSARLEHIESDDHKQKFVVYEEELKKTEAATASAQPEFVSDELSGSSPAVASDSAQSAAPAAATVTASSPSPKHSPSASVPEQSATS